MPTMNAFIAPHTLTRMKQLKPHHPVFKLFATDGDLVIKMEGDARLTVGNAAAIMTAVDPGAKAVMLLSVEMAALKSWSTVCRHGHGCDCAQFRQFAVPQQGQVLPTSSWMKMEAKANILDLGEAADNRRAGDKTDIRRMTEVLRAAGGLEQLGAIIAADAFNGSNDRFAMDGNGGCQFPLNPQQGEQVVRLQCLANVGNVFVAADPAGGSQVVGLDFFDPGTAFRDWAQPLNEAMSRWPGRLLKLSALGDRILFMNMVVADLETTLGPRDRKVVWVRTDRMPKDAAQRLNTGMVQGADRIKRALIQRARTLPTPIGLQQPLSILGWLNHRDFPR